MSNATVRCPECRARVDATTGKSGRYWCTTCDNVFEVHDLPDDEPRPVRPRRPAAARTPREEPRRSNSGLILAVSAFAMLCVAGMGVAGYFLLRNDPPKEVAADSPKPEPPKAPEPVPVPKKEEPKKKEPKKKEPTQEEVVRGVKSATVYVRTTFRPGQVDSGSGFFAGKPGFVVTNAHVVGYGPREVRRPARLEVVLAAGEADERTLEATLYGADVEADLALLKVEGPRLP